MQNVLTVYDFEFIISAVGDALEEILQRNKEKKESMYNIIEAELRGYNKPFIRAAQCPLCPHPQKNQSWEMILLNYADWLMWLKPAFIEHKLKNTRP